MTIAFKGHFHWGGAAMLTRLLPVLLLLVLLLAPTSAARLRVPTFDPKDTCVDLHLQGPDGKPVQVGGGCPETFNSITFEGLLGAGQAEARFLLETHPQYVMLAGDAPTHAAPTRISAPTIGQAPAFTGTMIVRVTMHAEWD